MLTNLLVAALTAASQQPASSPVPPPACTAPQHRQFDFWVGEWAVSRTGKNDVIAKSRIDRLHDGCVIREQWMPNRGGGGSSLNHYDPADGRWHQTWIDSSNAKVEFDGGLVADKMVLTGFWKGVNGPGKDGLVRMSYSKGGDGSVRQFGEISADQGLTWKPFFDLTYRPVRNTK